MSSSSKFRATQAIPLFPGISELTSIPGREIFTVPTSPPLAFRDAGSLRPRVGWWERLRLLPCRRSEPTSDAVSGTRMLSLIVFRQSMDTRTLNPGP